MSTTNVAPMAEMFHSAATQLMDQGVKQTFLPTRPHHTPNANGMNDDEIHDMNKKQNDQAMKESKSQRSPNKCEPVIKLDGSLDCKHGFRSLPNGTKQPCIPRVIDGSC